ncbi:hypothetical protein Ae201684P_003265 [Aphanomyces euteiches]|nr:hypothetical protein Ae201684P_003265 [Aphanomyces euteiches]
MPSGLKLSDEEQIRILAFHRAGWTHRAIAAELHRSKTVVQHFLSAPNEYGMRKQSGRPRILTPTAERYLIRKASNSMKTAQDLRKELKLPISNRTILHYLNKSDWLVHKKLKKAPCLSDEVKKIRQDWALDHITWPQTEWDCMVFSDEKRFNLDGPDVFAFYWHDIRKEEKRFSQHQHGGGGVMVWGAFCRRGVAPLVKVKDTMDRWGYVEMLGEVLLPFIDRTFGRDCVFQQDNAPCHAAIETGAWFLDQSVNVMEWPPHSPDLNPMENLWSHMMRVVYHNGRQYQDVESLEKAVRQAWEEIPQTLIDNLISSMQRRSARVLVAKGNPIPY